MTLSPVPSPPSTQLILTKRSKVQEGRTTDIQHTLMGGGSVRQGAGCLKEASEGCSVASRGNYFCLSCGRG